MYHYAYVLTFPNNMRYIGARSSVLPPELDTTYLGSGKALPKDRHDHRHLIDKKIIQVCESRSVLMQFEMDFIIQNKCITSPEWYNQRLKTHDRHGEKLKLPIKRNCAESLKKRETFSRRYGNGYRTPAQLQADKNVSLRHKGVPNPKKAHKGIDNHGFVAWYYITPEGVYVEVHDKTKEEMAEVLGFTKRQLGHGFHYTNQHKCSDRHPRKGWTFGNLPKPTKTDTL